MSICYNCQESGDCDDAGLNIAGCGDYKRVKTRYICPDCGWTLETRAHRIRCGECGSLNLERKLLDGRLIKADAWELDPNNAQLIHYPRILQKQEFLGKLRSLDQITQDPEQLYTDYFKSGQTFEEWLEDYETDNAIAEDEGQTHSIDRDYDKTQ